MKEAVLFSHLGLGDHLVQNALVRSLAKTMKIVVLAKFHNVESCRFMWRDCRAIEVFGVKDDAEALEACEMIEGNGAEVIRLGYHRKKDSFDMKKWDQEFYRQAGVNFQECWNHFKVDRQPVRELVLKKETDGSLTPVYDPDQTMIWPDGEYAFVHEDAKRGFEIDPKRLPKRLPIVRAVPTPGVNGGDPNIFDWWGIVMNAHEIHAIDSSFSILVDHSPELKAKRIAVHHYVRKEAPPHYMCDWERINSP